MSNFTRHQKDGQLIILITTLYLLYGNCGGNVEGGFFLIIIAHISYKMMFHVLEFK